MQSWIIILVGVGAFAAAAIGVTLLMLVDPTCPHCRQRDWSKGIPAWRCRHCGTYHSPSARKHA